MRLPPLLPLLLAPLALTAALDANWATTLDDYIPIRRAQLPHLDTFTDQPAFEADATDDTVAVSLNARSTSEIFGRAAAATCACPAGYRSCCPKWDRCFKPPPEKMNCCKVKTGTVACKKPKTCCYNGCVSLPSSNAEVSWVGDVDGAADVLISFVFDSARAATNAA